MIYKVLETLALTGFGLRGYIVDVVSIQLANVLYLVSASFHLVSVVSFTGKFYKKFSFAIGVITLISIFLFMFFVGDGRIRVTIISLSISILFSLSGAFLYVNRASYKLPILLAIAFVFFAIINTIRAVAIMTSSQDYQLIDLVTWDSILVMAGIATILISSFGFLLLLKEVDDQTIYRQNRITSIAFEESPVSIVMTDKKGDIEFVNPKFSELTGYSGKEAKGKNTSILKTSITPSETYHSLWNTIRQGKTWHGEFVNKKKNGEIYYEEAVIAPIKNARQQITNYLAIKIDITQRKASEQLLQKRNQELSEINSTKDRLFSIIGHDLKGPIGNLKQLLEFINQDIKKGDKESVQQILKMTKETAETSFDLLENLLNWSRTQLNVIEPQPDNFDIALLVEEISQLYQASIQQKKITLDLKLSRGTTAFADRDMVSTVIRNLLSNAIKFTPPYGSVMVEITQENGTLTSAIKDSGVGIEEDRLEKIFDFKQNQSTKGTAGEKGTGIGLALSREFIIKNGGKIWVESTPGKGSTFFFSLPIRQKKQEV
jgi:PAS domain S-box-containing protein